MGSTSNRRGYRSLFWPIVLISVGVIWLLGNLGVLGPTNLLVLFRLWPLLLIAIGLDLLIGRDSALIGTVIGVGTVGLVIVLMLVGPGLGLVPSADVQQATIREPLDGAQSADITLDLSVGDVVITALDDSSDLIAGEISYVGDLEVETIVRSLWVCGAMAAGSTSISPRLAASSPAAAILSCAGNWASARMYH